MTDRTPTGDGDEEITPRVETVSEEDVRLVAAATGGVVATEVTVSLEDPEDRTPTGGLRDQIAEALHCPTCGVEPGAHCLRARVDNRQPHMTRVQAADAVLPVVEAETARARASCCEDGERTYAEMERHLTGRAEEAERQRDTAREALAGAGIVIASLRDQRDEALAAVQRVRTLGQNLADGLDPDGHDDDAAEVGSRILRTLDHSKESSR